MRVMVCIDKHLQVNECVSVQMLNPGELIIWTPEEMLDIVLFDVNKGDLMWITNSLLSKGYVDLSKFEAIETNKKKYFKIRGEEEDDDRPFSNKRKSS